MHLSRRLEGIASLIPPGGVVADIGGDRGELSYALLERGIAKRIILTDLSPHSLNRARELFAGSPLRPKIEFRLGAGFSVLQPGEARYAILAGMGGGAIIKILAAFPFVCQSLDAIFIQAMRDTDQVRLYLTDHGMRISDEKLIQEDGIFYAIIKAEKGTMFLQPEEALLGPVLLARREPLLGEYLKRMILRKEAIFRLLNEENQGLCRRQVLENELELLRELYHGAIEGNSDEN